MTNKNTIFFITIFVLLLLFNYCDSDSPTNPSQQSFKNYFPGAEGTSYIYDVEQVDTTGIVNSATRSVYYGDEIYIDSVKYRIQMDSVEDGITILENLTYFRKTPTGVFYYADTSQFFSLLPDSIKNLITTQDEMRILLNPIASGSFWPVFRVTLSLQPGINFSPFEINGYFIAQEYLTLNLKSGTEKVLTEKVKYDLDIVTDLNQTAQRFSANLWFADEIGIVKMKGSSVVMKILLTGEIIFDDDTSTIKQELISYDIK